MALLTKQEINCGFRVHFDNISALRMNFQRIFFKLNVWNLLLNALN